jgi:hypothetical protein
MTSNIQYIIEECEERPPGSIGELEAQEHMKKDLENWADKTYLEKFKVAPKAFMGFLPVIGVLLIISVIFYWFLPLIALILDLIVLGILILEFVMYKKILDPFFPKKTSHNLIAIKKPTGKVKQRVIFGGHADAAYEWRYNTVKSRKMLRFVLIPAVAGLFLKVIIDIFNLIFNARWTQGYLSFWGLLGVIELLFIPIIILIMRFSDFSTISPGANDNLSGCYVANAIMKFLAEENIEFENTELILLNSGSEEAGLRGTKAYTKRHKTDLKQPQSIYIAIDTLRDMEYLAVISKDLNGTVSHDPKVCNLLMESGKQAGYDIKYSSVFLGSTDATAFTQAGIRATSLTAMDPAPPRYYHTKHDNYDILNEECLKSGVKIILNFLDSYDKKGLSDLA